jgi:hypothetical protein
MPSERLYPKADRTVSIITTAALIVAALLLYNVVRDGATSRSVTEALFIPIVAGAWCFHPRYYLMDNDSLKINRPAGSITIPYNRIKFAGYVSRDDLGDYARMFASGGLFGYFGLYRSKSAGAFFMWCANKKDLIAITQDDDKVIIISPPDPDSFIDSFNRSVAAFNRRVALPS